MSTACNKLFIMKEIKFLDYLKYIVNNHLKTNNIYCLHFKNCSYNNSKITINHFLVILTYLLHKNLN